MFDNAKIKQHIKHELEKIVKSTKRFALSIGVEIDKSIWNKFSSKLGKFNEMPNALKLSFPFEESDITLFEEEIESINCRNLYLHGKTPKLNNPSLKCLSNNEIYLFVSNTLRMLVGMLLLKKQGLTDI